MSAYASSRRHNPELQNRRSYRRESLKSYDKDCNVTASSI
jgi:hypothetical protein